MKYLKKFNESKSDKAEEIKKFCEENLAYLLDVGFELGYYENIFTFKTVEYPLTIHLSKRNSGIFKWSEIVDDFVPFLQILNSKYELIKLAPTSKRDKHSRKCTIIFHDYDYAYRYSLEDIINDRTDGISDKRLRYIEFSIKI